MDCKLNLGCGDKKLEGFDNLDLPWRYETGLRYKDDSVDAITISHSLMYVRLSDYPYVFSEFYRVLKPEGVIRITEDDTMNERSERVGGYPGANSLTYPEMMLDLLEHAGFKAFGCLPTWSSYKDDSLMQNFHGTPPKVFFVEGIK